MAEDDQRTAARAATSLRDLVGSLTELPARPTAPSGRTRPPHAAPSIDLGILDHLLATRDEIIEHTRTAAPDAVLAPVPRAAEDIYQWWADNTAYLDAAAMRAGEAIVYRQGMEHRIRARDTSAVREEPCPSCGCYGLVWRYREQRAVCTNDRDDEKGRPRRWTLAQLAERAVENLSIRVAT